MNQTLELCLDTFGDITDGPDSKPLHAAQVIRNLIDEAVLADEVGVDAIGVGEHHRADFAVSAPEIVLAAIADKVSRYVQRWRRRRVLWVGITTGGIVDAIGGTVDHDRLGWTDAPLGPVMSRALNVPVSVASHVDAMAGAELLLGVRRPPTASTTSLYVYARETVGYALSIGGRVHSPTSGPGTIAGLPAQSELLGGSGQLESTVSDEAVLTAARKARIIPAEGPASTVTAVLKAARQGNQQAAQPVEA